MSQNDKAAERVQFEAWADKDATLFSSIDPESGAYRSRRKQTAWEAWQAASAEREKALTEEVARLRADAARLDWLERGDERFYNLDRITSIVRRGFSPAGSNVWHRTLRAAIDTVLQTTGAQA